MDGPSEEPTGGREILNDAGERARRLRAQAEMAWARVQRVARRGSVRYPSLEALADAADRVPTQGYLGGLFGAMVASGWLHGTGRRDAGIYLGVASSLLLGAGLYLKLAYRSDRGTGGR